MKKSAVLFLLAAMVASASSEGAAWASSKHSGSVHRFPAAKSASTQSKTSKTGAKAGPKAGKRKAPRGRRGGKKKVTPVVKG